MNMIKITTLAFSLLFTLASCTNMPTHLIVAPQVNLPHSNQFSGKTAQLNVIDMRTSPHIIQILEDGEAAIILSSEQRIESIIQEVLSSQWQRQGLQVSEQANNQMTFTIEKAIISVDQQNVNYTTQTEILIKATIDNGKQTLTSNFKTRAHNEGPLHADVAALEHEFNQHLSILLQQVLSSKDIQAFL